MNNPARFQHKKLLASGWRRRWLFHIIALSLGLLLAFGLAEIATRLYVRWRGQNIELMKPITGSMQPGRVEQHPFLPMALVPNTEFDMLIKYEFTDNLLAWHYTTNEAGFRGDSVDIPRSENSFRVLTLGGSATFGEGVDDDDTWSAQLERMIQADYPDLKVEVLNFGIPTATSAHAIVLLALRGVHYRPDIVIFYEAVNDISCCLGYENFRTDYSHRFRDFAGLSPLRIVLPDVFYQSYAITLLNDFWNRKSGGGGGFVEVWDQPRSANPLNGIEAVHANINSMRALTESIGGTFILSTYHFYDPSEVDQAFNDELRAQAQASGIDLIDQAALLPTLDKSIHIDGVHFTSLGNTLVASNILDYLEIHELIR
ncbi:MAG: SGNH/GDSL hydrolase family protein [Anaerolineae bacterium]|nr:SGNH/GDSL hydrolase family protein [Anaerolineae bacterium]